MAAKVIVAAGLIVYRTVNTQTQFLLLQHAPSKWGPGLHWTPPKGHVDPGENELTAAYRETAEESGIGQSQLELVDGFRRTLEYKVKGRPKTVLYCLAKVRDPDVAVRLSHEHQAFGWFDLESAVKQTKFDIMENLLKEADAFIGRLKG